MPAASDNLAVRPRDLPGLISPSDWIGPASLVYCPLLLVAFLSARYGLELSAGLRALAGLYALGVVPGYLAQRFLFRVQPATPFEGLLSSLLLGTLLTPLLWYTLCWVGLSATFFPGMFALALAVPLGWGWHRNLLGRVRQLVDPREAPILWVAVGLAVLWSWQLSLVAFRDGQVVILPHNDHLLHTSLIAEMARGVPPATVPFIAVADKWAYHYLPDVWCDLIRRVAGTDARDAYFYLALPLRYPFVCFACYLALVRRFGRTAAIVGAGCLLAVTGYHGSQYLGTNWLLTYLHWNYPCSFGLVGVFLILYYASTIGRERPHRTLLLMSILSGLLFWYKANFALAVVPAVSVFCLLVLARRGEYRWFLPCVAIPVGMMGIRWLEMSSADLYARLALEPLRFIRYLWWQGTLWLKALDESGPAWFSLPVSGLIAIRRNVDALPELLKWPAAFVLCMIYLFHLPILVGAYARMRCGFGKFRSQANSLDVLVLLILLFVFVGFVLFPIHQELVWNVSKHNFALVYALLLALAGPAVCGSVRRAARKGRPATVLTASLLLTACVANTYALGRKVLGPAADVQDVITKGQYDCYRYIEAATPRDAMILQPRFEQGLASAGMLTQRRIVLEWGPAVTGNCCDLRGILADLRAFYGGAGPDQARAVLARYDVDYVVADRSLPRRAKYGSFLIEVYRSGGTGVYRVDVGSKLATTF